MHISRDLYLAARRGHLPPEQLLHLAHRHLLEVCPACRLEFVADRQGRPESPPPAEPPEATAVPLPPVPSPPTREEPIPEEGWEVGAVHLAGRQGALESIRNLRDLTRRHFQHLLQEPPETWEDQVAGARSRFRLRAFAERLIEESRRAVWNQPDLARRLAALVPVVLRWIPGAEEEPWSSELEVRSMAWQANALRVAGDLRRADALFGEIRREMVLRGSEVREWARGEIASLRASLLIEQRRSSEARRQLREARAIFQRAGDAEAIARTLIKEGNLLSILDAPTEALDQYALAANQLSNQSGDQSHLLCCVLSGQVAALTRLSRNAEAQALLEAHQEILHPEDNPYACALSHHNQGRIALGLGDLGTATQALRSAQRTFLKLDRHHDALLPSLDLAQVHLEAGRLDELHDLAADLVIQFQARGVARETLAALQLLARAAAARQVSRELLGRVRARLQAGRMAPVVPDGAP